jgi:acetylornithine deacetylase/succinyl-diaminopimelate desuccinylase-like protein
MNSQRKRERVIVAAVVVILAAAVVALVIYNRIESEKIGTGSYIPHHEKLTPEVLLLQQYVKIDTTNPPGNEIAGARWLGSRLTEFGIPYEIIESAPGRANLYARIRGATPGDALLLINHIDVVRANPQQWTHPPFRADISLNMLWARGTVDMKSIGIAQLEAFIAVAKKGQPRHDIIFLATADEEQGSALGTRWLLEHRPDIFSGVKYALAEGGITEMEQSQLVYYGVEVGAKQIVVVNLTAPTREQLQKVRTHLESFYVRDVPDRVLPEVVTYFQQIAPVRIETRDLLADLNRTIANGKFWLLPHPYRSLTQDFVWAKNIFERDGHLLLNVQLSNLPDSLPDERIAWLAREVAPFGASVAEVERKEGPVPISPWTTPMFGILEREVHNAYGPVKFGIEILATSSNESRFLRPRGIVSYGFQPFPLDFFQSRTIHAPDERVTLDYFTQGVEVMRRVVLTYAGL